ncbi:conserved hypothetical protein [Xanthomonas oryzae pv. oryzae KACC 10331]|uniref:Zinc finger CHCC-type domain-containing protein n=9 Tax=Xanthomonas oryzae TaxID=347 RepID=Q5H4E5_XANOR|nr:conserved hypothetical protein [Xanthomonas oryzae pv. oryzae KACC 10331]
MGGSALGCSPRVRAIRSRRRLVHGLLECWHPFPFDRTAMSQTATAPANAQTRYTVHRGDLPLSCPTPEMALWNSHPRVYLPIKDEPNGEAKCPYCGALFVLAD